MDEIEKLPRGWLEAVAIENGEASVDVLVTDARFLRVVVHDGMLIVEDHGAYLDE